MTVFFKDMDVLEQLLIVAEVQKFISTDADYDIVRVHPEEIEIYFVSDGTWYYIDREN